MKIVTVPDKPLVSKLSLNDASERNILVYPCTSMFCLHYSQLYSFKCFIAHFKLPDVLCHASLEYGQTEDGSQ